VTPKKLLLPQISPAAPGTLYQQIVDGLRREIAEGRLRAGAALPSFRGLAEDLLVSVITVKRAYEELEREGMIYRRQGLGTFVADTGTDRGREVQQLRARDLLEDAVREAVHAGISPKELVQLVQSLIRRQGAPRHAAARA
jgi:GntR family transcriptional regulator